MKCKKHFTTDLTSTIGVCATCLRDRLIALLAAQSDRSDPLPNISPNYNSHRKTHRPPSDPNPKPKFCTASNQPAIANVSHSPSPHITNNKKTHGMFSLFASFFKPKSHKETPAADLPIPKSGDTMIVSTSSSCSSPFWLSAKLSTHNKNQSRLISVDEPVRQCDISLPSVRIRRDRGMSPARVSDDDDVVNGLSQKTPESFKQTPSRVSRRGGGHSCHSTNVSGFSFCLSPLVRASPSRTRNQKGPLPEVSFSGSDARSCGKPPLSMATKYCANRSRKIADFGRSNHNH